MNLRSYDCLQHFLWFLKHLLWAKKSSGGAPNSKESTVAALPNPDAALKSDMTHALAAAVEMRKGATDAVEASKQLTLALMSKWRKEQLPLTSDWRWREWRTEIVRERYTRRTDPVTRKNAISRGIPLPCPAPSHKLHYASSADQTRSSPVFLPSMAHQRILWVSPLTTMWNGPTL